jgi:respiratory burst oxidase
MDTSVFPAIKPVTLQQEFTSLSEDEIDEFVSELNPNEQGNISLRCLERKLEEVLEGLDPEIREHYFHHVKHHINDDLEKERVAQRNQDNSLQVFLHNLLLLPHYADFIPKDDLKQQVRSWNVPSQKQNVAEEDDNVTRYSQNLTFGRRVRAYWSLNGPRVAFLTLVTASILSFGIWQLMEYATNTEARVLLGWGVLVAKGFAGAIYPTLFIL